MSRLVQLDAAIKQELEPEGYQFGQPLKKEQVEEMVAMVGGVQPPKMIQYLPTPR